MLGHSTHSRVLASPCVCGTLDGDTVTFGIQTWMYDVLVCYLLVYDSSVIVRKMAQALKGENQAGSRLRLEGGRNQACDLFTVKLAKSNCRKGQANSAWAEPDSHQNCVSSVVRC